MCSRNDPKRCRSSFARRREGSRMSRAGLASSESARAALLNHPPKLKLAPAAAAWLRNRRLGGGAIVQPLARRGGNFGLFELRGRRAYITDDNQAQPRMDHASTQRWR